MAIFSGRAKFHLSRKPGLRWMFFFNHGWTQISTDGMGMFMNHERHETHETKSRVFWEGEVPSKPQTWFAMDVFFNHGWTQITTDGMGWRVFQGGRSSI
jgi:hypothetical protein